MKPSTADNLVHLAGDLELVPIGDLTEAFSEAGGHALTAEAFGQVLVRRELLTGFQVEKLLKGDRTGFHFGRAKILYQIGAGSFARVYRGIHRDNGSVVAVKVLRKRFTDDPDKCRAFQHEGEMGRLLRHPNIVAIEDVGQENGASYLTMEFVEGQTLRELVRIRGAVDVPRALDLMHQAVCGLEYAHRRGVTHRDMKASNVIVSATGQAKIVDFGLAGVDESGDMAIGRLDKPRTIDYAALEKLAGVRDDAVRSDIYFLGTVAYLALAGVSPLMETRDRALRSEPHRYTSVEPLGRRCPDLPRDVVDIVSRMMHLDPDERWQSAYDVRQALEAAIARRSTGVEPVVRAADTAAVEALRGSVMLVESDDHAQRKLRDFFAKLGYRVLVTESPERALVRFSTVPLPADILVISTHTLGEAAVEAFNRLPCDPYLARVPAILIVGSKQAALVDQARIDDRRRVVSLPLYAAQVAEAIEVVTGRKA